MTKNKKQVNNKRHMKKNVKDLIIFIVILTILGLIFMNFLFTFLLVLGIILILVISNWFSKKKKKKWIRITINCLAIFIFTCLYKDVEAKEIF